jgi:signal transduction histidine kinase
MRPDDLSRLRPLLEPAIGVAFFVLWGLAGSGRLGSPDGLPFYSMLALYAVALGVARRAPRLALGIVAGIPIWQMLGVTGLTPLLRLIAPPDPSTWTISGAALGVAFLVALAGDARIRVLALVVGALHALSSGYTLAATGTWLSWAGYGDGDVGPDAVSPQWALTLAAMHAALYLGAWAAGVALQQRTTGTRDRARIARVEEDLEVVGVELRIAQERSEIAQEVHDVLAHSLAVVVAVADGSRFLRETRPETTEEALREIAGTARTALLDLRDLIEGLTDDEHRPQPNLADIPALVRRMSATGMRVGLRTTGRAHGLTPSQQLSVYRIVQESLTNALKHASGTPTVDVSFVWQGPGLALTIRSVGSEPAPDAAPRRATSGGGFGTRSMKDRARLAGGWLTAERTEAEDEETTDGYLVTVFVPTYGERPADGMRTAPEEGPADDGPRPADPRGAGGDQEAPGDPSGDPPVDTSDDQSGAPPVDTSDDPSGAPPTPDAAGGRAEDPA